jgi:hypothetical protein
MKVEHSVPLIQQTEPPEVSNSVTEASMQNTQQGLDATNKPITMSEEPQTSDEATHPMSEKLDADLPFERDELLKPDSHPTSHGPKVWKVKDLNLKLSALEATVAVKRGVFTYEDFEM